MEALDKKKEMISFQKRKDGFDILGANNNNTESSLTESSETSSEVSTEDVKAKRSLSSSSPPRLGWPIRRADVRKSSVLGDEARDGKKSLTDSKFTDLSSKILG